MLAPLPINRNIIIRDTRDFYGPVLAGMKKGRSSSAKKKFPDLYRQREELSISVDDLICLLDRILIPPTCRQSVLDYLHSSHFGWDKMRSAARMTVWWPELNADIENFIKECQTCSTKPKSHSERRPWPLNYAPMHRLHLDFCGPFLQRYYAIVAIDSYGKFPEVAFTTDTTTSFVIKFLHKFFFRGGIPQVVITDNAP